MSEHNGKAPLPFAIPPAGVPIIGDPIKPLGGFSTIHAQCNCGGSQTGLLFLGGNPAQCPSCRGLWVCAGVTFSSVPGQPAGISDIKFARIMGGPTPT